MTSPGRGVPGVDGVEGDVLEKASAAVLGGGPPRRQRRRWTAVGVTFEPRRREQGALERSDVRQRLGLGRRARLRVVGDRIGLTAPAETVEA